MVRTGQASGPEGVISGEPSYLGGLIEEWGEYYVFIAYSGAPEEVDVEIAKAGFAAMPSWEYWIKEDLSAYT